MLNGARVEDRGFSHAVLFYRDREQYEASILTFTGDGLSNNEPVLLAVPGHRIQALWEALGTSGLQAAFIDIMVLGRNPARIMPALLAFADQSHDQRIRVVIEPAWPGRTADETREVCINEGLINQAFAGKSAAILCLYDRARLTTSVIADARSTHPFLLAQGQRQPNEAYIGPIIPAACQSPLPPPPATAEAYTYYSDLRPVRELVARHAASAGLPDGRAADLVLAVSELAANTLRHTGGNGTVHIWSTRDQLFCQVHDHGYIADPLAGRRRRTSDGNGQGLWVVNQVCDLVEVRSGPTGSTIRVRIDLVPQQGQRSG